MDTNDFDVWNNLKKEISFTDLNSRKVSAILAQARLLSVKRLQRKLYTIPKDDFYKIKRTLFILFF